MPAQPRFDIAHTPKHIIQRGVDRCACFRHKGDYRQYLDELEQASKRHGCAIHAYVLMTNHVHLLVTAAEDGATSRMMQQLGTRYVRYFNARHERTGTLWEGRFRSCLIDSERYFLTCQRYIELNPVRAGLAGSPGQHPWSSYHCNAEGRVDRLVTPHPAYTDLAKDPLVRQRAYAALVAAGISDDDRDQLRRYTQQGRAWGSAAFQARVGKVLGHHAGLRRRGRQCK